jgi:hypothetical protein
LSDAPHAVLFNNAGGESTRAPACGGAATGAQPAESVATGRVHVAGGKGLRGCKGCSRP